MISDLTNTVSDAKMNGIYFGKPGCPCVGHFNDYGQCSDRYWEREHFSWTSNSLLWFWEIIHSFPWKETEILKIRAIYKKLIMPLHAAIVNAISYCRRRHNFYCFNFPSLFALLLLFHFCWRSNSSVIPSSLLLSPPIRSSSSPASSPKSNLVTSFILLVYNPSVLLHKILTSAKAFTLWKARWWTSQFSSLTREENIVAMFPSTAD